MPTTGGSSPNTRPAHSASSLTSGADFRIDDPGSQRMGNSTSGRTANSWGAAAVMPLNHEKNSRSISSVAAPAMACEYISTLQTSGMVIGSPVPQGLVITLVIETGTG